MSTLLTLAWIIAIWVGAALVYAMFTHGGTSDDDNP
jgi:hypothetical protein